METGAAVNLVSTDGATRDTVTGGDITRGREIGKKFFGLSLPSVFQRPMSAFHSKFRNLSLQGSTYFPALSISLLL